MDENYTFWLDLNVFRCFKIPNAADMPEGETTLYTFLGQKRQVDLAAVLVYELPVADVQSYLQDRMLEFFKQSQVQVTSQDLRAFLNSLAEALADTIAADATGLENARRWTHELRLKLAQLGVEVDSSIEAWPDVICASYRASPNQAGFHDLVNWLHDLAAQIDQPAGDTADLADTLSRLGKFLDGLFKAPETEEERQQRYREMARQAMPPIPRPDIKQMIADYKAQHTLE